METSVSTNNQFIPDINIQAREQFLKRMNEPPPVTKKQSDYAKITDNQDGYDTIPIALLENQLDETYLGLWSTTKPTYQVMANEIAGTMELSVYDPSAKVWLTRVGWGAITVRQKKDSKLTDIDSKIKTALQMDFAKLGSVLLKNACKKLGKKFGRDLNRKFEDYYEEVYTNEIELSLIIDELTTSFNSCEKKDDLLNIWLKYPQIHGSSEAQKLFSNADNYVSLKELFESKKSTLTPSEITRGEQIIANKESNSYSKFHKYLQSK